MGRHLVAALAARGDEPVPVSRRDTTVAGVRTVLWSPGATPFPPTALDGAAAVVNLAGVPLSARRWSRATQRAITESRVTTTRGIVGALTDGGSRTLLNASAVGYYGATGDPVDESAPPGHDFLASVCQAWEAEARAAADRVARVVVVRSGVVLATDGGALPPLVRLARLGVLGAVGSGAQWVPWVHLDDEVAAWLHALDHDAVRGPINVAAPGVVRQRELAAALRRALRRPAAPPAPAWVVRAALGEAAGLVLTGQRAVPAALLASGFTFRHPTLETALAEVLAA